MEEGEEKARECGRSYSSFWILLTALERLLKLAKASNLKDVQEFSVGQVYQNPFAFSTDHR